jgi:undecaprenyl-diphosphatase
MRDFDIGLFRWINQGPEGLAPLMVFLSDVTRTWPGRIFLLLAFLLFLIHPRLRRPAVVGVVAWLVSNEICDVLKDQFKMLRPSVDLLDAIVRVEGGRGYGTASAHSASMMAVTVAFMFVDRRVGAAWLVLAILTGYSRIYGGVHYPSQVLYGFTIGALMAWAIHSLAERFLPAHEKGSHAPAEAGSTLTTASEQEFSEERRDPQ